MGAGPWRFILPRAGIDAGVIVTAARTPKFFGLVRSALLHAHGADLLALDADLDRLDGEVGGDGPRVGGRVRPIGDEELADLKLALTEACTNSVRHAYEDGREGVVDVRYELNGGAIAGEVERVVMKDADLDHLVAILAEISSDGGPWTRLELPDDPAGVSTARRLVRATCLEGGRPDLADEACLVASELVSNALVHAPGGCELRVRCGDSALRIDPAEYRCRDRAAEWRHTEVMTAAFELLLELELPPVEASVYLKAMDRKRWSFPQVGVAAARHVDGSVRIALAGVAPIPWRVAGVEALDTAPLARRRTNPVVAAMQEQIVAQQGAPAPATPRKPRRKRAPQAGEGARPKPAGGPRAAGRRGRAAGATGGWRRCARRRRRRSGAWMRWRHGAASSNRPWPRRRRPRPNAPRPGANGRPPRQAARTPWRSSA